MKPFKFETNVGDIIFEMVSIWMFAINRLNDVTAFFRAKFLKRFFEVGKFCLRQIWHCVVLLDFSKCVRFESIYVTAGVRAIKFYRQTSAVWVCLIFLIHLAYHTETGAPIHQGIIVGSLLPCSKNFVSNYKKRTACHSASYVRNYFRVGHHG